MRQWQKPVPEADPLVNFIYFQLVANPDISKTGLGKKAGVDRATINYWFKAQRDPTLSKIRAVLAVLGYTIKIEELYEEGHGS